PEQQQHWSLPYNTPSAQPLNTDEHAPLLPEAWAKTVTSATSNVRSGLGAAASVSERVLLGAHEGTTSALSSVQGVLVGALSSVKTTTTTTTENDEPPKPTSILGHATRVVSSTVDSTADAAISGLNSVFSFAELLSFGTFHVANSALRLSLGAASETANVFNALFGSTESSRALTHLVALVQHEILLHDPQFATRGMFGNAVGAAALTGGITKALTAYACLQVMTKDRTLQARRVARLIEESVSDKEDSNNGSNGGIVGTATGAVSWLMGGLASGVGIRMDPSVAPPLPPPQTPAPLSSRVDFDARQRRYQWQRGFKSEQDFVRAMEKVHVWNESLGEAGIVAGGSAVGARTEEKAAGVPAIATAATGAAGGASVGTPVKPSTPSNSKATVFQRFSMGSYIQKPSVLTVRNGEDAKVIAELERVRQLEASAKLAETIAEDMSVTESEVFEDAKSFISVSASGIIEEGRASSSSSSSNRRLSSDVEGGRSLHRISMQSLRSIFEEEDAKLTPRRSSTATTESAVTAPEYTAQTTSGWLFDYVKSWIPTGGSPYPLYNSTAMPGGFKDEFEENHDFDIANSILEESMSINTIFDQVTTSRKAKDGTIRRRHRLNVRALDDGDGTSSSANSLLNASIHLDESASMLSQTSSRITHGMGRHFPMLNLLDNLTRYAKHATASYGSEFMTVFDVGNIRKLQHIKDPNIPMNHIAFATHVSIPVRDVVYSSYVSGVGQEENKIEPITHYVSIDREAGVVVVTLRGTLSLSDLIVDLKFDYASHKGHKVHAGMLHSCQTLLASQAFIQSVKKALLENPAFGLIIVGHSLGGAVATLVGLEWSTINPLPNAPTPFSTSGVSGLPPHRPIHVYSYGTPCLCDFDLSTKLKGLVTSVIHGDDFIPTISVGMVRDMKTVTMHLLDPVNKGLSEKIISRTLGLQVGGKKATVEEEDFFFGVISELRGSMKNDRLYPSGTVYWISHTRSTAKDPSTNTDSAVSHVILRRCEDVREICHEPVFSAKMMSDHIPKNYEECVIALKDAMEVARSRKED
ncbi:hypothetical protein BCR33DRAFT_720921, partial [Rhizoclosmatium globosum]